MKEKINDRILGFDTVVRARLKSLIDTKVKENRELEQKLSETEQRLDSVNKSVERNIMAELDLASAEKEAMERARGLLERPRYVIGKKNTFRISGKIVDERSKIGLPGLQVKISGFVDEKQKELSEAHSDTYGNFTAAISLKDLKDLKSIKPVLTFSVYSDPKTLIHREDMETQIKSEGFKRLTFNVPCGAEMIDRLEGGKNVRDSFDEVEKVVRERFENMKRHITPLKRLIKINREDIRTLRKELSAPPPDISPIFEGPEVEKPAEEKEPPSRRPIKERRTPVKKGEIAIKEMKARSKKEKATVIELEKIKGIGSVSARKLREAGIKDLEDFSRMDIKKLRTILGNVNILEMKKKSKALLKKEKKMSRKGE